jgi:hypothetical protein
MRIPAALGVIALALGAISLAPIAKAREEGSIEIEKCQTINTPGSYKFVKNLSATGDCLVITADFVTIDLAGFTITGNGITLAPGTGIVAAPPSGQPQGIAVRNGSISGFLVGVDLGSAAGSIVEGLRVFGKLDGAGGSGAGIIANGIVKGNTASGYSNGISANGVVTGNNAGGNFEGIFAGAGSTVIGNTANGNARIGIGASCPVNLTDNTAIDNRFTDLNLIGNGCHDEDNVTTAH